MWQGTSDSLRDPFLTPQASFVGFGSARFAPSPKLRQAQDDTGNAERCSEVFRLWRNVKFALCASEVRASHKRSLPRCDKLLIRQRGQGKATRGRCSDMSLTRRATFTEGEIYFAKGEM